MTGARRMSERLLAWAEYFLPADAHDAELVRRVQMSVAQALLGLPFALVMTALYAIMGSPVAALAIATVAAGLAAAPWSIRRGVPVVAVGNATVALTWLATLVVALRSGGFASPAVVWNLLLPLPLYAVGGRRSALVWSALAGVQMLGLYLASVVGVAIPQDLSEPDRLTLQILGYGGVASAMIALLLVLDDARAAAARAQREVERGLDRQRILDDMHDGVGSNLLGLLVEARANTLQAPELIACLETSLDDLRLIVDSLDPLHASLDGAFAALRARLSSRCEALGVEMSWDVDPQAVSDFDPADGLQVLRGLQEMVTNALRHSQATRIDVRIGALAGDGTRASCVELAVRDHGVGLRPGGNPRGRGLKSLRVRARKLGGSLVLEAREPGLRVALEIPRPPRSRDTGSGRDAAR